MASIYEELSKFDLTIRNLGEPTFDSPLNLGEKGGDTVANYVSDNEKVFVVNDTITLEKFIRNGENIPAFEKGGPRKKIFFEPGETISAIVTCGGLCPGLNAVIRAIVLMNYYRYNNKITYGIRYGYQGFIDKYGSEILNLTPKIVESIHREGGTILGSSRGPQDIGEIVDKLVELKVNVLYTIGGDGTLRGAHEIYKEISKRNLKIAVVGVPKTIDNDLSYITRSFGVETAFSTACEAITAAHTEAKGAYNGIGLVKVMGRESGFIAAYSTLASNDVNFTLVPEVKFNLEGDNGLLATLKKRLQKSHHAVILVAEGAGQYFFDGKEKRLDKSGNVILNDIGLFLKEKIGEYFKKENVPVTIRYIDPSYIIRSMPPTPNDSIFCLQLAQNAVHAGMAGKTNVVVGNYNGEFVHLPIEVVSSKRRKIDPESELWLSVLETTGQPVKMYDD